MAADAVVAINGVWILVETYTLNSKISPRLTLTHNTGDFALQTSHLALPLQVDFLGPDLSPGVTLFFWPVSRSSVVSDSKHSYDVKLIIEDVKLCIRSNANMNSTSVPLLLVYGVEVLLKISGLGPMAYFSSGWNLWVITWTLMLIDWHVRWEYWIQNVRFKSSHA